MERKAIKIITAITGFIIAVVFTMMCGDYIITSFDCNPIVKTILYLVVVLSSSHYFICRHFMEE